MASNNNPPTPTELKCRLDVRPGLGRCSLLLLMTLNTAHTVHQRGHSMMTPASQAVTGQWPTSTWIQYTNMPL